jgi:hypothetical protein
MKPQCNYLGNKLDNEKREQASSLSPYGPLSTWYTWVLTFLRHISHAGLGGGLHPRVAATTQSVFHVAFKKRRV